MDKGGKAAEAHERPTGQRSIGVHSVTLQNLARVVDRVQDRALAGTVGAEKEGDRLERDRDPRADAFEVLDGDAGDHAVVCFPLAHRGRAQSSPLKALWERESNRSS